MSKDAEPKAFPEKSEGVAVVKDGGVQEMASYARVGDALEIQDGSNAGIEFYTDTVTLQGRVELTKDEIEDLGKTVRKLRATVLGITFWAAVTTTYILFLTLRNVFGLV